MNLKEFGALKVGDKISNPMNLSGGTVSGITDSGVRVRWGASTLEFFYSVNSTAWMHWSKEDTLDQALDDELANPPASIMKP